MIDIIVKSSFYLELLKAYRKFIYKEYIKNLLQIKLIHDVIEWKNEIKFLYNTNINFKFNNKHFIQLI